MLKIATDFSGIGSPEQAIKNLNIPHKIVFSCEIDAAARKSYEAIHGKNKVYNDITERDHSETPQLDLYVAGFPCQAFSMAGQRKGFDDVRGTLFFNVADFIRINQPETFILENVKGLLSHDKGRTFQTIIDLLSNCGGTVNNQMSLDFFEDGLGYNVFYQVLNTKQHGIPQNRERVFIVGFKKPRAFSFPTPEPLKLKLKDILEETVDEKYFLSDDTINKLITYEKRNKENGNGFGAKFHDVEVDVMSTLKKGGGGCDDLVKNKTNNSKGFEEVESGDSINIERLNSKTRRGRVGKGVANTLDTKCEQVVLIGAMRGRDPQNSSNRTPGAPTEQRLEVNKNGTSNTITSVQKDNYVVYPDRIRRLTPLECWRLQGFPDEQFYKAQAVNSDTQLYKQAGNSITVNVIQKVIYNIYK